MKIENIKQLTEDNVLKTYGRREIAFETGYGAKLFDSDEVEYLDFTSGLGVNALGYAHPKVAGIIHRLANKVIHTSNLYHIPSQAILAEKLCDHSFGEKVFFCNSGAESVEAALKFARKWGSQFDQPKTEIVAFKNSFHGRTLGALSATMQEKYRTGFEPLVPGFKEAIFNDAASLDAVVTGRTTAIIVEPLQGEGGVNLADAAFMKHIWTMCDEKDILLIVDEVQCGMGRTGKLFAYEHFGVTPDIMTLAKPLAGGLPIGATVVGPKVWPSIKPGEHASTFGGNHFVTGVANEVFDIISDQEFIDDVASKGDYLKGKLEGIAEKYESVKEVRGAGLLSGIQVDFPAMEAMEYFEKEHILICPAGPDVIRFIPPLIITTKDIDRVIETLDTFLGGRG